MSGAGRHPARWIAAVLALAGTILAGCAATAPATASPAASTQGSAVQAIASRALSHGATAPVDASSWAIADRLTAATYTADTTAALIAGLARSGIATFSDPSSPTPEQPLATTASAFELLDFQAHALAVGAWAGSGFSGADLDGVVPLPDGQTGLAPTSALLAGYVAAADSPGAALSRALMAGQDLDQPSALQFPAVVLVLFASDLSTDGGRLAPSSNPSPASSDAGGGASPTTGSTQSRLAVAAGQDRPIIEPAVALDAVCSDASNWINGMLGRFWSALKVATPANLPGLIVVTIWNWLVDQAQAFVNALITTVTDVVLSTIRSIAASISAVADQIASFLPYVVKVEASQPGGGGATFMLGKNPLPGTFTATITAGDLPDWPAILSDCASTAGIALPKFKQGQIPLTWGPLEPGTNPLISPLDSATTDAVTDANGQATWGFVTARDPGDPTGEQANQVDTLAVSVHRPEIAQARAKLTDALLGFIPALLRPYVAAIFAPYLDGLQTRLNLLLDAHGSGRAQLVYHEAASPSPSPSTTPAPSGSCSTSLPAGTYTGTLETAITTIVPPGQIDLGEHAGLNDHGTGPLTVVVAPDGTLSGSFSQTLTMHFEGAGLSEGTTDTTVVETGAGVSGTLCSLTLTFASETITACTATGHAICGETGQTINLAGLAPPMPMGAPTSVAGGMLTWSISAENGADLGFGGLSAETASTITVTLQGR